MIVHNVDLKVREPSPLSVEKTSKQFQAVLAKVVSEDFERHQGAVMSQALGKQSQAEVVDLIVSHVQVNQGFVNGE